MRKFLLLCSMLFLAFTGFGQDTLYFNDFESPNSINMVYQDTLIRSNQPTGTPPSWAIVDTFGYNSDSSYHVMGAPAGHLVYFITDTIDATLTPYVNFSFWHIAKVNPLNGCYLEFSVDGGQTWDAIPIDTTYQGESPNYGNTGSSIEYFNQISYGTNWGPTIPESYLTPLPSWWRKETFDLTNLLSDLSTSTGYSNILIRFYANFGYPIPGSNPGVYGAGWYVDDILLTGSPCELNKPKINFNFTPLTGITGYPNCFETNPEGPQTELASANYPIAARITDNLKFYDTGVDTVMVVYQVNGGVFDTIGLDLYGSGNNKEYRTLIPSLSPGDSVNWYMLAYDSGCPPNEARMPDITYNSNLGMYSFFIEKGLPGICGTPNCGSAPYVIRTIPWTENFDNTTNWIARTGNDLGTIPESDYWRRAPAPTSTPAGGWYGVAVNKGGTPSAYTGPSADHTTGAASGQYIYMEAGNGSVNGYIQTPCIDLTNQTGCLGFEYYYHMFGDELNGRNMTVLVDTTQNIGGVAFSDPTKIVAVSRQEDEQQKSSTEAWRRGVFSLNDFVGKYIRVRFAFRPGTSNVYGRADMAVDDFRIFSPDTVDVEVIAQPEPKKGYCDFQGQPVDVIIRNNGCNPLSTVPLAYKLNTSATVYRDTAVLTTPLQLGDSVTYTFGPTFPAIAPGSHQLTAWSEKPYDAKSSNDTAIGEVLDYHLPINTFPFIEDFEAATVGTQNLGNTNWFFDSGLNPSFQWQVDEEMTDERSTGPFRGYHHEGKYLFAHSGGSTGTFSTYLRSKCLDFSTLSSPVLYFYYHMYGANIDKLEVQVSKGTEPYDVWTTVTTINNGNQQADELADWKLQRVNLASYASQFIKVRFKVTRKNGGNKTNLALDKIMIFDEATSDVGAHVISGPANRGITAGPSGNDPKVVVANFGSTTLNTCSVHFKITLLCNPSVVNTYSLQATSLNLAPGATKEVDLSTAGVNYPIGEFEAKVYATHPNGNTDPHAFNDTIKRNIIGGNNFYEIPWMTNFDTCEYDSYGFIPSQGFWQWELGKPDNTSPFYIDEDRTIGGNAWVTNLNEAFIVGTEEQLRLPIYNGFDTVKNAQLRFYMNSDFGPNIGSGTSYNIAAHVKYFNANQWKILGENTLASNLGYHWYGDDTVGAPAVSMMGGPAWVGSSNGAWLRYEYPLNGFSENPSAVLRMRLIFKSDAALSQASARDGLGLDDFEILIPEQNSVAPVRVNTVKPLPLPGQDQKLNITIGNTGEKTIDSCLVEVFVGGVSLGPAYWVELGNKGIYGGVYGNKPSNGSPLSTAVAGKYTFELKYDWPAAMVTSGDHEVCVVTSRPNNKPDNRPTDDTLCVNLPVMLEVDMTHTGDDSYCDDFEDPSRFQLIHKDAKDLFLEDSCWVQGNPTYAGGAHSGSNAWMVDLFPSDPTNPNSPQEYKGLEQAALLSPVFIIDTGIVYEFNFWHWLESERYHDGGNVEYTFDGGLTWYTVGFSTQNDTVNNWFSDPFVTSLDQIRGGWTNTTKGWINSKQFMRFGDGGKMIFRFRWATDYDVNDLGWVIDDFCFRKDTGAADVVGMIGTEEQTLPEDAIVGEMVPNPAVDHSQLSFLFPTPQDVEIRVHNIVGQVMETRSASFTKGTHTIDFNTSNWAAGVYFVNFEFEGKLVTRKLVVK